MVRLMPCLAALLLLAAGPNAGAQTLPAEIQTELEEIPAGPDNGHLPEGADYDYGTPFPTSGPHAPRWTAPGLYSHLQQRTWLVHALEHGNIVIYYDQPGEEATTRLLDLAQEHDGQWDGIVVAPAPGLGEQIVLTAWEKRLTLERWEEAKAAAFIDAFRGRGPEHPVR